VHTDLALPLIDLKAFTAQTLDMTRELDRTDWNILGELQRDARQSFNQLAKRVALSAPAVAERVRRLENDGVITRYQAIIDNAAVGLPLTAFVQMRCSPGRCLLKTTDAGQFPEVAEIHKLSGVSCTLLKVRAASMAHLEGVLERLGNHGPADSHIVLSTHYDHRPVQAPPDQPQLATTHEGWRSPP
jgi:Lrp/AsnC family transcriptional regulator, leucine-responsive regulatory protein